MDHASPYSPRARWRRTVLECSLKPFDDLTPAGLVGRWTQILTAWAQVLDRSDALGVLLWVADGSEILSWSGDLAQRLEWARYVGFCNTDALPDLYYPGWYQNRPGRPFRDDAPEWTYGDLAQAITALRQAAAGLGVGEVTVGATIDPGPEFAASPFKYVEHPEILVTFPPGPMAAPMRFVSAQTRLHADPRAFGGWPQGIPEDTPLGAHLGAQMRSLAAAVGFDYLWLSNGFGYSHYAWTPTGELLRPEGWRTARAAAEGATTLGFWRSFREQAPDLPLEVRGTNYSLGVDLATDGVSHRAITALAGLTVAPPNLPVLHADLLAQDVVCYLTRLAQTPGDRLPYRHYLNDPWFEQNPWYDIYAREPLEAYTALACSRLNDRGGVDAPSDLHVLSIDTERGQVLPEEVNEVAPHLLRALDERADAAGPLVWVYPYDDYHDVLEQQPDRLPQLFAGDQFVEHAVAAGLPLLTVCDGRRFAALQAAGQLPESVYLAPAPVGATAAETALLTHGAAGGPLLVYGSLEHAPRLREYLGLALAEPLEGEFSVTGDLDPDLYETVPAANRPLRHRAVTSGGGLQEVATDWTAPGLLVTVTQGNARRAYAAQRGNLIWIRGSVPCGLPDREPLWRLRHDDPAEFAQPALWLRALFGRLGWALRQERAAVTQEPVRLFIKRCRGAFGLVGAKPDTTVHVRLRAPDGAPLFGEYDTRVVDGHSVEQFGKTIVNEVRAFVDATSGRFKVKAQPFGLQHQRSYAITGLRGERLTFYPDPTALAAGRVLVHSQPWAETLADPPPPVPHQVDLARGCLTVEGWTGPLFIKW
ncbi:MAG: hypothetical protein IT204_14150 [Fimbriimonadaceae bacterium]|nr:hypothetical protein [Fimbriimonadaceae bacterium]